MEDIGLALADFVSNLENVPSEIRYLFSEISELDEKYEETISRANKGEAELQKLLREDKGKRESKSKKEEEILDQIEKDQVEAKSLCTEKIRLTKKAITIVQRHLGKLDAEIRHFDKKSALPVDISSSASTNKRFSTGLSSSSAANSMGGAFGTVGIQNGQLTSFKLPDTPKFDLNMDLDHLSSGNAGNSSPFYTPSRAPKRNRNNSARSMQQQQQQKNKKQLKLSSVISMDGMEIDSNGGIEESDDQLYCFCQQVSYGDMVACDGPDCRYEWFHWDCVGLTSPPKGSWYCSECLAKLLDDE